MKHASLMLLAGFALMACAPSPTDTASTTTPPASSAPATPQSEPAPPAATPPPATTAEDTCNMAQYSALIGKPATDSAVPAAGPTVRLIRPGTQVTMEFMATRLNIEINSAGVITGVRCG